jgi:hypothetical protein
MRRGAWVGSEKLDDAKANADQSGFDEAKEHY